MQCRRRALITTKTVFVHFLDECRSPCRVLESDLAVSETNLVIVKEIIGDFPYDEKPPHHYVRHFLIPVVHFRVGAG